MNPVRTTAVLCGSLALAFAVLASPTVSLASAQDARLAPQLIENISAVVRSYPRFTVFDSVEVATEGGVATLTGKVTMPFKKDDIGRRVASVAGVSSVINRLEVLPASPSDDSLRYAIARAIYGNPTFWGYASMANPPIHIVVDGGRVTLTGVVKSEVERMLARSLASGFGEMSVTNNLRTDAEMRAATASARNR